MARPTPAVPSLPSAILEAAIGLGVLEVGHHESGAVRFAKGTTRAGGPAIVEVVIALLERAGSLETLDLTLAPSEVEHVWRALLADDRPTLRVLRIVEQTSSPDELLATRPTRPRMFASLGARLPALEVLALEGPPIASALGHDRLRELHLLGRPLKSLRALRAPALERLVWRLPAAESGVGAPHGLTAPLWRPGALPSLKELDVSAVVLDEAMWTDAMVTSDLLAHLNVLRAPGIDDPKLILAHVERFRGLERFEVPWIDGSGADELVRGLSSLRVREREEHDEDGGVDVRLVGDEAWILGWRGFTPAALKTLPDAARAVALHAVHWDDDEAAAFGRAAAERFERIRGVGERLPGDALVRALASALPTSRLTSVSLTRAPASQKSAEAFARAIESARALRTLALALDDTSVGDATSALARGLVGSALEHLRLEGPWLVHGADGTALGRAVSASALRSISVVMTDVAPPSRGGGGGALGAFVTALGQRLFDRIAIVHNEGPGDFAEALPPTAALAWRRARVRVPGARALGDGFAAILQRQPQLRDLDLHGTELMADDVRVLAQAIASHPALESIRMSHVVLDDDSVRALAETVRRSTTLSRVELFQDTSYNSRYRERFPYVSLAPLLDAIAALDRPFALETHAEGEDEERLLALVHGNRLRGFGASLRAAHVPRLAAALPGARALASLDLRQSELDEAGLEALCATLPQSSLRSIAFTRYFGLFSLGNRAMDAFAGALARTNLEEIVAPFPRRELLALGERMPSLRRFNVRSD